MGKIFVPAKSVESWKELLAKLDKQWKQEYSARSIAYCWQEAGKMPNEVKLRLNYW